MLKEKMMKDSVCGALIKIIDNPAVNILAKDAGMDFLFYDLEHGMISYERLHDLILMGKAINMPSLVRVPQLARGDVSRALDCGAEGVMVPMLETETQAIQLVGWAKYMPIGQRGYSGGANTFYKSSGEHRANMDEINKRTICIAQIETVKGIENAEKIAQVEGIDVLLVGPADLCISNQLENQTFHPEIQKQIKHVAQICQCYHKGFGIIGSNDLLKAYYKELNILVSAIDYNVIRQGFIDNVGKLKEIKGA